MTNPFVISSLVDLNADLGQRHFPLPRGEMLQKAFAQLFSRHLGLLQSGKRFEAQSLLVTGPSGSGKTTEIEDMLRRFNDSGVLMPGGKVARFASCLLDSKGTWKDLGRKTLVDLGYPITNKTRRTQFEIWNMVIEQAKRQGVVGIYYDEAQHIMRGKSQAEVMSVLDVFKTLMKSHDWPLMLILSGVPELGGYVAQETQLERLMTRIEFSEIDLKNGVCEPAEDYLTLNEIVGSYAIRAELGVSTDLQTGDFLHRLATAGAFRWGLVIDLVVAAVAKAVSRRSEVLEHSDFVEVWCEKTSMNQLVTPFTHEGYETMFRRDRPFRASIGA